MVEMKDPMKDPRMKHNPNEDITSESVRGLHLMGSLERTLGVLIRLAELKFANSIFKDFLQNSPEEKTFADTLSRMTAVCAEIDDTWHSEREFSDEEAMGVNLAYENGGVMEVMRYLEAISPAKCPALQELGEYSRQRVVLERGTMRVSVVTLDEHAKGYGLKQGDKIFEIEVYPIAEKDKHRLVADDPAGLDLKGILRELAKLAKVYDVKGVGNVSWLFDVSVIGKLGFLAFPYSDNERDQFRNKVYWLQLLNADGTLNGGRLRQLMERGKLPYDLKVGFMPTEVLVERHGSEKST